jgi:glutamate formiminotransferase
METVEHIANAFRAKSGVKLLDYSADKDHNRMVVTAVGEPEALKDAVVEAVGIAVKAIDLNTHRGEHPRIGAVDVIPFIPLKGCGMEEAIDLSKAAAGEIAGLYNIPVFMYEKSASAPHRRNLADIRKGGFEGLDDKLRRPEWQPDYGRPAKHPTAGAVAVGARPVLIAYNINLGTDNVNIAKSIAGKVRCSGGGLRGCKAMGVKLEEKGITQVSMNLTDYALTSIYQAFEAVKTEARRYGTAVIGSEIIGLAPMDAIVDAAAYYLQMDSLSVRNILEYKLVNE